MDSNLSKLREFLLNELSEQELIALCKDIGLDYRSLAGTGAFGKTRELLIAVQARGQIPGCCAGFRNLSRSRSKVQGWLRFVSSARRTRGPPT